MSQELAFHLSINITRPTECSFPAFSFGTCILATEEQKEILSSLFSLLPEISAEQKEQDELEYKTRLPLYRSINTYCTGKDIACGGTCGICIYSLILTCERYVEEENWYKLGYEQYGWLNRLEKDRIYNETVDRMKTEWNNRRPIEW
jgi:hypothetical protein